ncbi:hypothetical protein [Pseudomarimonas salicorniae]|uniref:Cyanophycinase n=1 Tax=Pseudomarimonas salicorniae TaxID=2933270 RepID=A0ABT0GD89_9GAMM|nr:hypothetical protein [Lysobacter sp. CAU 1642]MCK7592507.1 hypothetical protein [Lysobacter sp. CAU 1642]
MRFFLPVLLLASLPIVCSGNPHPAERLLAGGSLALCSSASPRACRDGQAPRGRGAPQYSLQAARIDEAVGLASIWSPKQADVLHKDLRELAAILGEHAVPASRIESGWDALCRRRPCAWAGLDDYQRAGVMAALEWSSQGPGEPRLAERVSLQASTEQGGAEVVRSFVASAAARAGGRSPRIAFVTASGFDPLDAVDYYTSLFTEAGAEPLWWPMDAALARLITEAGDCSALARQQQVTLGLPDRSRVFPDLVAMQQSFCASSARESLPEGIQGVFFAGGDQWRLRRAFFDDADAPYPWLRALREAVRRGEVVVGGTSAGTAVQSGPGMLSNGSPQSALRDGPLEALPPTPGCARAKRCGAIDEEAFTVWAAGGFGLSGPFLMDTHFSERAREWRLLRALAAGPARAAIGVDETSAIRLVDAGKGWALEAIGASGGWLFEAGSRACGELSGRAHYLAPGRRFAWSDTAGLQRPSRERDDARESRAMPALALDASPSQGDAFARGAVRAAATRLALGEPSVRLATEEASLVLVRGERSEVWTGTGAHPGITHLDFTFKFTERCGD